MSIASTCTTRAREGHPARTRPTPAAAPGAAAPRASRGLYGLFAGLLCLLALFGVGAVAQANSGPQRLDHVEAELVADVAEIRPGQAFRLGLRLRHDPHWHTYWRNPGDSGLPTQFDPTGPAGARFGPIAWPTPERIAVGPLANYGYEGELILARTVRLADAPATGAAAFRVDAQWLVCRDVCIPGEATLTLDLPVVAGAGPAPASAAAAAFDRQQQRVPDPARRIEAGGWQRDGRFVLQLPEGLAGAVAEFFPYFEGVVKPAGEQSLAKDRATGRLTITMPLVDDATRFDAPGVVAGGVVVVDARPYEVAIGSLPAPPAPGEVVSVAAVAPDAAATAGAAGAAAGAAAGGSLRERLVGAASAGASGAAAAGSVRGSGEAPPAPTPTSAAVLALAVIGAMAGGLLLNLMPCVFPVIGLKVMSFAQAAGGDSRGARRHALAFAGGVILSFALLGMLLVALRSAGEAIGWGFQMQSPVFVSLMALLFVLIALNLFGLFEVGASLTTIQAGGQGLAGNFWTGVVAVLVATPCTAPFMGSALGFTLSAPAAETLLVFVAMGVGMALPYLLLGYLPSLLGRLPRPGPWIEAFKQLLAFPMLATAAWLAWVLTLQAGADALLRLLAAAILLGFAGWLYGRRQRGSRRGSWGRRALGPGLALIACLFAGWQLFVIERVARGQGGDAEAAVAAGVGAPAAAGAGVAAGGNAGGNPSGNAGTPAGAAAPVWQPWSVAAVAAARAASRPVFVDFTAAWCISCQANKKIALEREAVLQAFAREGVVLLRADWTRRDAEITRELARHRRNGVPLYLFYGRGAAESVVLPELLTVDTVLAAVSTARAPQAAR